MNEEKEKCPKCSLTYGHQIGCSKSGLPNYQKSSTIDKVESKKENHVDTQDTSKKLNTEKRRAKCIQCALKTESNSGLAFFESKPEKEFDSYYCGCYGWD